VVRSPSQDSCTAISSKENGVSEEGYQLALAVAQIMPGPLAAQLAIALGYFQHGLVGATAVGLAFIVPSFLMVLGISMAYVRFGDRVR
jgi:chromate transporter